ncbi:lysozyme inhibitor LprI family protein [Legionella quateirensis]|uniref:Uncharacterized protein conserved in bacteria n=1 Tax=Legionella quateirensis TaxID=45072 RepID=A0A378KUW3_9GAMM|nr:lysozyme inhibitor LprI family protein [Legionella quateirensis]KTD42346.1 hypothetical protein Lqua_3324 [Legionella quateirensis]STY17168.1 Uncharacterized protein conserved in bacteria [Legionella quateirensis]
MRANFLTLKKWTLLSLFVFSWALSVNSVAVGLQDTRPAELDYANTKLNSIYQKIIGVLNDKERLKLRNAQRSWLAFRDQDCAWWVWAEPLECLIDRTENRTKELTETFLYEMGQANKGKFK